MYVCMYWAVCDTLVFRSLSPGQGLLPDSECAEPHPLRRIEKARARATKRGGMDRERDGKKLEIRV